MRVHATLIALAIMASCLLTSTAMRPAGVVRLGQASVVPLACATPRGPLVAYGHSYLHSPGIGGARASYATVAAAALRMKPVIRAVDRSTTLDVERLVRRGSTRWVPGSARLVVIDSAINDIGLRVPTAQWTAALRRTLDAFAARPAPTVLLVRPLPVSRAGHPGRDPRVVARYAQAQRSVAARYSAVRIVDATPGWNRRLDLSADGVHPNPTGMVHLARALKDAARHSYCRP